MRAGCTGCLIGVVLLLSAALGLAGGAWVVARLIEVPAADAPPPTAAEAIRAQRKIFSIVRSAESGRRGQDGPVVLTEGELNAFLARNLPDPAELPLGHPTLKLVGGGVIRFRGTIPVRHLLRSQPASTLAEVLPTGWLARPVSLGLEGHLRLESAGSGRRRYLRLDVDRLWLGRQRLPASLLRFLFDPARLRLLRWSLPVTVESVTIEPGRAVIATAE
jgi:hypothetical protein